MSRRRPAGRRPAQQPVRAAAPRRSRLPALLVGLAILAVAAGLFAGSSRAIDHPDTITVTTATGDHAFTVEWASTPGERAQGLMDRTEMAPDHGMVFDFGREQPVSFWMKNTPLPLDMVFIHEDGTVYRIEEDTEPFSLTPIPGGADVRYVLEVLGGTSERIGLKPGDHVDLD